MGRLDSFMMLFLLDMLGPLSYFAKDLVVGVDSESDFNKL